MFSANKSRERFPALNRVVDGTPLCFLDGPGGTQVPDSVTAAMTSYLHHGNSNLGGVFQCSEQTSEIASQARYVASVMVNAPSSRHMFFGANMTSITFSLSRAISRNWKKGDEIIISKLDHYANVSPWVMAAQDKGVVVREIEIISDDCTLDYDHLATLINEKTCLVAVTCASNLTGSHVDVRLISDMAKKVGAQLFLDAVHYTPHQLIDVKALKCDFLVCSAYKFFGPHLGIAYVADPWLDSLMPYKVQPAPADGPARFETGTLNFEALAGFIAAVNYLATWSDHSDLRCRLVESYGQTAEYERHLSRYFLNKLDQYQHIKLHGVRDDEGRTPTFALSSKNFTSEYLAQQMAKEHIYVWNGHFYALDVVKHLNLLDSGGVLRVGFMHYNTEEEVERFFNVLGNILSTR
ncbi:cysteine desulfurase-like protein [Veronia pacifica]|uniref:Cysteine desulfurase-like protein n=1 Tax=Veronia pacifica TaxID=1080227 RepID=A0A1C3EQW2_9GAMM|nr:cysteine desulfurase-like protein [Veronia pacifica]ODA35631.1 cysteine desulfurase-like protein [Veronia pacifica]